MIKELNIVESPNWAEQIKIEIALADLQIIYDCVGAVPLKYLKNKHKNTDFEVKLYTADMLDEIYNELDEIIDKHNGITDDNENVNLDAELIMSMEEE